MEVGGETGAVPVAAAGSVVVKGEKSDVAKEGGLEEVLQKSVEHKDAVLGPEHELPGVKVSFLVPVPVLVRVFGSQPVCSPRPACRPRPVCELTRPSFLVAGQVLPPGDGGSGCPGPE